MSKFEYYINLAIFQFEKSMQKNPKGYYTCWVNDMAEELRKSGVDRFKLLELLIKQC